MSDDKRLANFLFEVGTMRKILRIHRQLFLADDMSDNIASHSFRVAIIAYILAEREGKDAAKAMLMGLLHDMGEVRSNDHNWVHKRYVKIFDTEIINEQLASVPSPTLHPIALEYEERESQEAIITKDADYLDQVLLLREYDWQGNEEARLWLYGKEGTQPYRQLHKLKTQAAKDLGKAIYDTRPSEWWENLWTSVNR